ncbi:hypothetical protein WA588_002753, partial [Blastocystis sp. NMH]
MIEIRDPLIECYTEKETVRFRALVKELDSTTLCDCVKLDELFFMTQHHDYFNLDFCTNLIESAQETAGRRLSLFIENNHLQWGFLPRTYKLFDLKVTLFDMEYRLLLIRVFAYRYSHPHETVRFLNPSTSQEVVFPPCLVTAETCNPEYRKGSVVDQKYVSPFAPKGICFETMVLDALCLFSDYTATARQVVTALKLNPYIMVDDAMTLYTVEGVLWYLSSVNQYRRFSIIYLAPTKQYKLALKDKS